MENYKANIIEAIENIESEQFLKFLYNLIESFRKTWGY